MQQLQPRSWLNEILVCYIEEHLSPDYPWKDKTNLKLCIKCDVDEHPLEYCLVMFKNIINKRNLNLLFGVPKNDVIKYKKLQIVMR